MNGCIVGYGAIGPVHANAISQAENARLYAVCDVRDDRARICAEEYNCIIYHSFDEVLSDDKIDVVHICTPHYLHKDMALSALKKHKNVVLEKPVAISMSDIDELASYVDGNDTKKLCVILQNRRNNCVRKLVKIMQDKSVTGELKGMIANLNWKRDEAYYAQDPWRGKWDTEGGGLLINQAVHIIDLMLFFGGKLCRFQSDIKHWEIENIEVEDNAHAVLYFENGAKGIFNATNNYVTDEPFNMEFLFEEAHFRYADDKLYEITDTDIKILAQDEKIKIGKGYWGNGHLVVIRDFYNILSGKPGQYTGIHDAYNAMKLIMDIYEANIDD